MIKLRSGQMELFTTSKYIEKLEVAFCRDIRDFSNLDVEDRRVFLLGSYLSAKSKGFLTEKGWASYALGVWWLGDLFELKSKMLCSLLASSYPEIRKVCAMNEWVSAMIDAPDNVSAADEKLRQEFYRTSAWGGRLI